MKTLHTENPSVYVGTYKKYNEGSIQGDWVELDDHTPESFQEACMELHPDEKDPEFMFQDYQGFPEELYCESEIPDKLWTWLELDAEDRELLAVYTEAVGSQVASIEDAQDSFCGCFDSIKDFVESYLDDFECHIPSWIVIDLEATWNASLRFDFVEQYHNEQYWFFRR